MDSVKRAKTKVKIPSELLRKIVVYIPPLSIKDLVKYPRIAESILDTDEVWNNFAGTESLPREECKKMIERHKVAKLKVLQGYKNEISFKTNQSDLTHLVIKKNKIFTTSDDQTIKMFDFKGNLLRIFTGHTGGVWAIEACEDKIVTGSTDRTAKIWAMNDSSCIATLKYHRSTIRTVKCIKNYVIIGSRDYTISVWNVEGHLLHVLEGHRHSVKCMDVNDNFLVSGSYDGSVKIWDYKKGLFIKNVHFHKQRVYAVKIYKDYIASSGLNSDIKISSLDGSMSISYSSNQLIIPWLDFHSNYLVSSGSDGDIVKYNYISREIEYTIKEGSPIKSQKIYNGLLIVGTMTYVSVYSFRTGNFLKRLLVATMISKVEAIDWKIFVGYLLNGEYHVSVFDYEDLVNGR